MIMELFINAINYCKDGLKKAIDNNEDEPVIQAWANELRKWDHHFQHYYKTCKNPILPKHVTE